MENNNINTEEKDIVVLLDENGEEARFELVVTFAYEGARYAALVPEDEAESEEAEVVMLRIEERDGEEAYVSIDNEVLLNEVFDEFLEIMDEMESEEEE